MASWETGEVLDVLHALRLKGLADLDVICAVCQGSPDEVRGLLDAAVADGYAMRREGRMPGWILSGAGRSVDERRLAEELDSIDGARTVVEGAYLTFLDLNEPFLGLCTEWQLRDVDGAQVPNDHADGAYDAAVVGRLSVLIDLVLEVVERLVGGSSRWARYRGLDDARNRVLAGERDWFTSPRIESAHTLWFELHEDLLATLGRSRSEEHDGRRSAASEAGQSAAVGAREGDTVGSAPQRGHEEDA